MLPRIVTLLVQARPGGCHSPATDDHQLGYVVRLRAGAAP